MIDVEVRVAEGMHEVSRLQPGRLGDEVRHQRVAGNIEGHAKEDIGRTLVELAGEPPLADIELEQAVAGRELHLAEIGNVPGRNHKTTGIRIATDLLQQPFDLVMGLPVRPLPGAPLAAIDRAEVAALVCPFIPDRDAVLLQIFDVGIALQEPQQLMDDGLQMQPLGGHEREALRQVEAHLVSENRDGAGSGPVGFPDALVEHATEKVVIGLHGRDPCFGGTLAGLRPPAPSPRSVLHSIQAMAK